MSLSPDTRLGVYEGTGQIGADFHWSVPIGQLVYNRRHEVFPVMTVGFGERYRLDATWATCPDPYQRKLNFALLGGPGETVTAISGGPGD